MSELIYAIAFNLLDYWILMLMTQYVCAAHMDLRRRNIVIGSCISALEASVFVFGLIPEAYGLIVETVVFLLSICLFSRRRLSDMLKFVSAFCIYYFLDIVPYALVNEIVSSSWIVQPMVQESSRSFLSLAQDVTLLALLLILRHVQMKYRTRVHFTGKEILGSIALCFFSFIDGALIVSMNRSQYAPVLYWVCMFIFTGGYVLGVGYFAYSMVESRKRIYRQIMASCEMEYLRVQLDSLQDVKENEAEVRKMRHDLTNHMEVISSLCREGDYEEVRRYTEQLSHRIPGFSSRIPTGNQVADLVVSAKSKICEARGIAFEFSGSLENLSVMSAPDICGLLANAYDNAIEACLPQPESYIRTRVSATRNYTVIEIVNPVEKKVSVRGGHMPTTKKNKREHGYGIEIMKQIAGRYNGDCTVHCDGKEFRLKLVLLT